MVDDPSSKEIGTFKAMHFAHCGELENIFKENPYGKQIMTYGMIETLHCLVKELVPLSNCAPHVLQFMCFLPCLKDDRVCVFILCLEEVIAMPSNIR